MKHRCSFLLAKQTPLSLVIDPHVARASKGFLALIRATNARTRPPILLGDHMMLRRGQGWAYMTLTLILTLDRRRAPVLPHAGPCGRVGAL